MLSKQGKYLISKYFPRDIVPLIHIICQFDIPHFISNLCSMNARRACKLSSTTCPSSINDIQNFSFFHQLHLGLFISGSSNRPCLQTLNNYFLHASKSLELRLPSYDQLSSGIRFLQHKHPDFINKITSGKKPGSHDPCIETLQQIIDNIMIRQH